MDNLNYRMQATIRVCEENIEKPCLLNNFVVKDTSLKDHIGRVGRHIKVN